VKIRRRHAPEPVPDWEREQEERTRKLGELNARREAERRRKARAERKAARKQRRAGCKVKRAPATALAPGSLRVPRAAALTGISVLVGAASVTSFAESYRALFDWSHEHGLSGFWSAVWPLQVDVFIAVGELALFVALADSWNVRSRVGAWLVTLAGLAVSVAGNVGHVHSHLLSDRATAAVPPLAAAAALAVGLGVLKRVVQAHGQRATGHSGGEPGNGPESVPEPSPGPGGDSVAGVYPAGVPVLNGHALPSVSPGTGRTRTPRRAQGRPRSAPVTGEDAEHEFMTELASGTLPSLRTIRSRMRVGGIRAKQLQEHLEALTRT